jgi:phenylpropionate dioxygenase-like ring-hydroxylating dioxygenase large terminal subunit
MITRPPLLKTPYGAYHFRDVPAGDAELTHVGPGTPGGEYLRRYWQPVALASQLRDLPVRRKILGEDLIVFRDGSGQIGLLQMRCTHRGTSLEFGVVAERGIRCCYHGWHFDVDGRILDTPGEARGSTLKDRLCQGAYPVHEWNGLVFAYMGPPDRKPPFPRYDTYDLPGYWVSEPREDLVPCNWVQMKENQMDPAHTVFLHTIVSGSQFNEQFGQVGQLDWIDTPIGMAYIHTRRVGDNIWVRMAESIAPNMNQYPATWEDGKHEVQFTRPEGTLWSVPVDDTNTLNIGFIRVPEDRLEYRSKMESIVSLAERTYEDQQRHPGDYEAQVGQGPIAIHALEHLAATDRGVIMFRRMLRTGMRAVAAGRDPLGIVRDAGHAILTYTNNTVVRVPPAATQDEDDAVLRRTGRAIAERYVQRGESR